jgi:uncharacterized protein (TIGR00369 family)
MSDTENLTEKLMAQIAEMPGGADLEVPPRIFVEMGAEIIEFTPGESMIVRFPVQEKYRNPLRVMQGGMIVAAVDCTMGPLSYISAPPSVTTQFNTSYIRPIQVDHTHYTVRAWITERTRRQLFMSAEVVTQDGKVAAISHATCMILEAL